MARERLRVEVGQQYRKLDSTQTLWEVVELHGEPGPLRRARICRVDSPFDQKTFAVSAMLDRKFFRLERDAGRVE